MKCMWCPDETVDGGKLCAPCRTKRRGYEAAYRARHPERLKAKHARYNAENKEILLAKGKEIYAKNRETRLQQTKEYYQANKKRYAEYHADWYIKNKERYNLVVKLYRKNNPDKAHSFRANRRARESGAFVSAVNRNEIFERDGYVCQLCGGGVLPFVPHYHPLHPTIDHIIPLAAGGTHEPGNTQTAHNGCNASKGSRKTTGEHYNVEHSGAL